MFHHHGFKGQFTVVGVDIEGHVRPTSLEALLSQFLRGVAELERSVNRAAVQGHWNHAMTVHFNHGPFSHLSDRPHPIRPWWERKKVGDDHAGLLCQGFHDRRAVAFSGQMEDVPEALFLESLMQVNGSIHDDIVMAQ